VVVVLVGIEVVVGYYNTVVVRMPVEDTVVDLVHMVDTEAARKLVVVGSSWWCWVEATVSNKEQRFMRLSNCGQCT